MNIGDIYGGLIRLVPPSAEPLSLDAALSHLHVDTDGGGDNDTYVQLLISIAREICESLLRRALVTQTWKLSLKNWPGRDCSELDRYNKYNFIKLPMPPLQSVTSVIYRDSSGVQHTMANAGFSPSVANSYNVIANVEPGCIVLPFSGIWPTEILMPGAPIEITYVAGYVDLSIQSSPPNSQTLQIWEGYRATIHAMKELVAYWYENRMPLSEIRKSNVPAGPELVGLELLNYYRIFD